MSGNDPPHGSYPLWYKAGIRAKWCLVMRRREFIALLGSGAMAGAWPHVVRAQQGKLPTIGFFGSGTPASQKDQTAAFLQRLREFGWIEDQTVTILYRWAEGRAERYAEIAADFVRLKVALIVASGAPSVLAAKQATTAIPIVFAVLNDPLGTGIVASLSRPGGNVTGLSLQNPDLAGKRVELLREVVPGLRRLAIMANAGNPGAMVEMSEVQAIARKLGLDAATVEIRRAEEIASTIETLKGRADALYACSDAFVVANRAQINAAALAARLPTMHSIRETVQDGGLLCYGAHVPDLFRRAGDYADKILRGAKPADLPVEQPTRFEFIVNLKTAKTLGVDLPPTLLARADEVIE